METSNKGRSCLVTSRVVRGRSECQTSVSGCQVTQGQLSNLGRGSLFGKIGASDFLRDWTMWQMLTQNPFLGLEIINHSSHWGNDEGWVMVTSTATVPKLLPLHISNAPPPHHFFSLIVLSTSILVFFPLKTLMKSLGMCLKEIFSSKMF